jgi:serine/threonine-protein kinase
MAYASIYAELGQKEEALAWLEKAYQQRTLGVLFLGLNPRFDSLRGDPQFEELVKRVSLLGHEPPR